MVRMPVADQHRIDLFGGQVQEQLRQNRVARVDEEPETLMFDEVAAAGLAGRRPAAATAEDGESHGPRLPPPAREERELSPRSRR